MLRKTANAVTSIVTIAVGVKILSDMIPKESKQKIVNEITGRALQVKNKIVFKYNKATNKW